MAEVLVLPQTQEGATPPPDDYRLRYSDLAPTEVAAPEVAAPAAVPPPISTAPPEDFRARYSDLSPTPATDEVASLPPPPEETPDFQSRYADLDPNQNVPATAAAVAEPIQPQEVPPLIINPREEEIKPTPYEEGMLNWMRRSSEEFLAPAQESGANLISPETADLVAERMGLPAKVVAQGMEKLTGLPYTKAEKGFEEAVSEALHGFTSLEGIAGLANPFMLEAFAVNTITNLPDQFGRIKEAVQKHGFISKESAKAFGEAGIADAFGFLALRGGVAKQRRLYKKIGPKPGGIIADEATGKALADQFGLSFKGVQKTPEGLPDFLMFEDPVAGGTIAKAGDTVADFGTHLEQKRATFKGGEISATEKGKIEEGIRPELEDRVAGGKTETPGVSDRLRTEAQVRPQEVAPSKPAEQLGEKAPSESGIAAPAVEPRGIPEGLVEEGLHTEHPSVGEKVDRYIQNNDPRGIFEALKDPDYEAYKADLERMLRRFYGDEIPVARVEGYGGKGVGESGGLAYASVSTNPGWGKASEARGQNVIRGTVKPEDVVLAGHEAEGELIVRWSGVKQESAAAQPDVGRAGEAGPPVAPAVEPAVPGAGGAMGAAGAQEKLATYKERKFGKRLVADEELAQELRDKIGNRYYEPISNETTVKQARNVVEDQGIGQSINLIKDETTPLPYRVRSAIGQIIVKQLNKSAKALDKTNPAEANFIREQAADLSEWAIKAGTDAGQTVQSFALWNSLDADGKLFQVQRMVKRTRDRIKPEVKQIVDTVNGQGDAKGKLKALRELAKTNRTARKIKSQFADIIKASEKQLLTEEGFYERVGDRLGLPKFTPEIAAEVRRLAEAVDDAPEARKTEATLALSRYIAALKGFDPKDVPLGVYYGNLLSGYNTQLINALDTFSHVLFETNNLSFTNPRAAAQIYSGLTRGLGRGIGTDFMLALKEGRQLLQDKQLADAPRLMEVARFGEKGGVPVKTDTAFGRIVKRAAESKVAYPLRGWKYVGHLMQASDSIMHHGLREARISLLADRIARTEGLKGDALRNRVSEILAETPEQTADFVRQAESEGFTGLALKRRINQLRDEARPEAAVEDAYDFAGEGTYNHKTHGVLGFLADKAGETTEKYKSGKLIVPFTQIVANVLNRRLDYSPIGFKRAFWGYSFEDAPIGDARAAAIMRASVGTAALTFAALKMNIHGGGPTDPERRKQLLDAGWKPYSWQIGNTYYSILTSPLGLTLGTVGNWKDVDRYHEMSQADAGRRLIYTVSKIPATMFAQSFLSNVGGWLGIVADQPGLVVSSIRSRIAALVGSATSPRIVTDLTRIWDPRVYRSEDLLADTLRNTPFAAAVGKAQLNAFGEEIRLPSNRFISTVSKDPVWQFVLNKGVRISVPSKYTNVPDGEGGKRRITADEYYDFLQESGREVKDYIFNNMDTLSAMSPEEAQDKLSDEAENIRKRVKTQQFSQ